MSINKQIIELLKSGARVYSRALGRVGEVTGWIETGSGPLLEIREIGCKVESVTSFDSGDKVRIQKYAGNSYEIVNVWRGDE